MGKLCQSIVYGQAGRLYDDSGIKSFGIMFWDQFWDQNDKQTLQNMGKMCTSTDKNVNKMEVSQKL